MSHNTAPNRTRFFSFVTALTLACTLATAAIADNSCDDATELPANATARLDHHEDRVLLRLDVPSAGIVSVDLSSADPQRSTARVDLWTRCPSPGATVLARSASHLTLAVRGAGTWWLRAGTEDGEALGRQKIVNRFIAAQARLTTKGDPEETDPDPDAKSLAFAKGEPEETDPDPDAKVTFRIAGQVPFGAVACPPAGDDHGDTLLCATPILGTASGVLGNDWGDDDDVFTFDVAILDRFEIATAGDSDPIVTLLDASGRRLAMDDDSGDGRNSRLVRTLAPGRYFVRVQGNGSAEGEYAIGVRDLGF